jgi:hypothetical protein
MRNCICNTAFIDFFFKDKVAASSSEARSGFPSLWELLNSRTSDNRSLEALCANNSDMRQLIQDYAKAASKMKSVKPAILLRAEDRGLFSLLLENSLVQYMAALSLPQVYRVWKCSKREPGYSPRDLQKAHEEGKAIKLPKVLSSVREHLFSCWYRYISNRF